MVDKDKLAARLRRIARKLPNVADCDQPQIDLLKIAAALEASKQEAQGVQVPDGWKPVPIKLPDAMIDAFENYIGYAIPGFRAAWKSLLAATPATPAQAEQKPQGEPFKKCGQCDTPGACREYGGGYCPTIPQAERVALTPLTEAQLVKCLRKANCIGKVSMSFESGPYDIDRPSINASRLLDAIQAELGIGTSATKEGP